jgi:hypothetical protein
MVGRPQVQGSYERTLRRHQNKPDGSQALPIGNTAPLQETNG